MSQIGKSTFAVFFGNRGFFPASLQSAARREMRQVLEKRGHQVLMLDEAATRHGAVETPDEGEKFAAFINANRSKIDGIILCLPNFGDETGAASAFRDAGLPILVQAYPDELSKMSPALRRDAFCGKFSIMDVFCQYGIKFTALKPHTAHPAGPAFARNLAWFDSLCRIVKGMKKMVVGAIGARTTAFKTVRIDELALQKHGITMETLDMSSVFMRVEKLDANAAPVKRMIEALCGYASFDGVPQPAVLNMAKLAVVLEEIHAELKLDTMAIRCWMEMQQKLGISPCTIASLLNSRGIPVACEVDVGSAVTMRALQLASDNVIACLDWNNNYGDDENKCILFHCGPVPQEMMVAKGKVTDHAILATALGPNQSFGCNTGRIKPSPVTYGNLITTDGKMRFYIGEGRVTEDPVPADFFGCAGVLECTDLQSVLLHIGAAGHRHHVALTPGLVAEPLHEAFTKYLGYEVARL